MHIIFLDIYVYYLFLDIYAYYFFLDTYVYYLILDILHYLNGSTHKGLVALWRIARGHHRPR